MCHKCPKTTLTSTWNKGRQRVQSPSRKYSGLATIPATTKKNPPKK